MKTTILKINQGKIDKNRTYDHEKSPEWPDIAKMMGDEITHQEKEFLNNKESMTAIRYARWNLTNVFFVFFKVVEAYSMGSIAFRMDVDWGIDSSIQWILNIVNTEGPIDVIYLKNIFPKVPLSALPLRFHYRVPAFHARLLFRYSKNQIISFRVLRGRPAA